MAEDSVKTGVSDEEKRAKRRAQLAEARSKRKQGPTRKTEWRVNEVRKVLAAAPLSDSVVVEMFTKQWHVGPRLIEEYIRRVRVQAQEDLAAQRPTMSAQMAMEVRMLYRLCISKGKLEAAGRCQDRLMRLFGLDAAQRVELTGRNGAPVQVQRTYDLSDKSDDELDVLEGIIGGLDPDDPEPATH